VFLDRREELICIGIVDGLGHGRQAHDVATKARRYLKDHWADAPEETARSLHAHLEGSIGAAGGIAVVSVASGDLRYVGIGNTVVRRVGASGVRLTSSEGTLGSQMRALQTQRMQLSAGDVVVFYTDGVSDRFDVSEYPGVQYDRASVAARTIVERFGKTHDDATCVVFRLRS
jgi:serine phosphatase RsbU (regulator of sigma subunit)